MCSVGAVVMESIREDRGLGFESQLVLLSTSGLQKRVAAEVAGAGIEVVAGASRTKKGGAEEGEPGLRRSLRGRRRVGKLDLIQWWMTVTDG